MTTSDGDGSIPFDPDPPLTDDIFPVTPAYGSRALGDGGDLPAPSAPDVPVTPPVEPPPVPVVPVDVPAEPSSAEQETVVLAAPAAPPAEGAGATAGAAYHDGDVLPPASPGRRRRVVEEDEPARRLTPTPLGRALLPLGLALVSAVALVAAWTHLQDDRAAGSAAPIVSPSVSATATPSASPSASPTASPSASPTASTSPSLPASPSSSASASGAPVASSPAASPSAKVDRSVNVVVLNSTSRTGLAARVAASLRKDGWSVVQVGNYRGGRLAVTTVFAQGNADAVATMAEDLAGRSATKKPVGAMNPARLTVVIGANYPRS